MIGVNVKYVQSGVVDHILQLPNNWWYKYSYKDIQIITKFDYD